MTWARGDHSDTFPRRCRPSLHAVSARPRLWTASPPPQPGIFLPRAAMQRLVKKMVFEETRGKATRLSREAYAAIHLAAEHYLTTWFELMYVNVYLLY